VIRNDHVPEQSHNLHPSILTISAVRTRELLILVPLLMPFLITNVSSSNPSPIAIERSPKPSKPEISLIRQIKSLQCLEPVSILHSFHATTKFLSDSLNESCAQITVHFRSGTCSLLTATVTAPRYTRQSTSMNKDPGSC
jgi:hypothetical protein